MADEEQQQTIEFSRRRTSWDRELEAAAAQEAAAPPRKIVANKLDGEKARQLHSRLYNTYLEELDRQRDNRWEMSTDEDFYDNEQWREEDKATLERRGQTPLVYNIISASVDWVTGTERRGRTDHKVLPRRREGSKPAEKKTDLMKYLSDVNRSPFEVSLAFESAVKAGLGWLEDCYDDDGDDEPIVRRSESWRNMLWDSTAVRLDLQDARFICRTKWVDLDIALAMFPKRRAVIEASAENAEDIVGFSEAGDEVMDSVELDRDAALGNTGGKDRTTHRRRRIRIIEMWYREPEKVQTIRGGDFNGEIFDPYSPGHLDALKYDEAELRERMTMRMYCALFTPNGMLWNSRSPYRHNRFPFTPVWGYRRARNNLPYGMIRRLRDIQEDVNKRASKALHILSTNKVIMEEGALGDDYDIDDFLEEVSQPDAVITVKKGFKIDINADRELPQFHLELMSRGISLIQSASGVTDENLGRRTNASSGIAIQRRQDQGALATQKFFDHLLLALQVSGEKQLSLIEQFMTEEKQFRITNQRGSAVFVTVNDSLPDNDIIRTKADFVIGEAEWQATMRNQAAQELMETIAQMPPAVGLALLDLVVENMDLRNRDEIVKRIRGITGQRDPDQDEPTPEEQAMMKKQAEGEAMQKAAAQAEIALKIAQAQKAMADAKKLAAQVGGETISAQVKAMEAAIAALQFPAAAAAADHIMHEAGFDARSDMEAKQAQAQAAQAAAAQAQQPRPFQIEKPGSFQQEQPTGPIGTGGETEPQPASQEQPNA